MTNFLTTLAEITLTMSAVILLLLALGPLLSRRYAAKWRYWAWLAVAVRLLIPFNLSLPAAPVQLEPPPDRVVWTASPVQSVPPVTAATQQPAQLPSAIPPAELHPVPDAPVENPAERSLTLSQVLLWGWAGGAALLLLWYLGGWLRFQRHVRRWAVPVADRPALETLGALRRDLRVAGTVRLLVCPGLSGPMMTGVFRPAIFLPEAGGDPEELWFILRHELTHYKRRDIPYKVLLLCAKLVHWFNPLVWMMVHAAEGDLERACDDDVVKGLPPEARGRYGQIILDAVRAQK